METSMAEKQWHIIVKPSVVRETGVSSENWESFVTDLKEKLSARIDVSSAQKGFPPECHLTAKKISWQTQGSILCFVSESAARFAVSIEFTDAHGKRLPGASGLVHQDFDDRRAWEALVGVRVGLFAHELMERAVMRAAGDAASAG